LRRVATIGDSITYGSGIGPADTLAARLETTLNAAFLGDFFETVNLGRNGSNIWHAWSTFEYHFAPHGFDAVVLTICDNDTALFSPMVRYNEFPWKGTFQYSIFSDTLSRIRSFSERHGILTILSFYSLSSSDIPAIAAVEATCRDVGLPFVDTRKHLVDEIGAPDKEYCASVLDMHPSPLANAHVARRIVAEIERLNVFNSPIGAVEIADDAWRLACALRQQGRAVEECMPWCDRVIDVKIRNWNRRQTKPEGVVLGDTQGIAKRIRSCLLQRRRALALHAWFDSLPHWHRSQLWNMLGSYDARMRDIDEFLYCVEGIQQPTTMQSMEALFTAAEGVQNLPGDLQPDVARQLRRDADRMSRDLGLADVDAAAYEVLPDFINVLGELLIGTSRNVERWTDFSESKSTEIVLGANSLKVLQWHFSECLNYIDIMNRELRSILAAAAIDQSSFTRIDVLIEAASGTDENGPRTHLYVAVDYKHPSRRRVVERQLCGYEKKRWVYSFQMPFFTLADISVYVPPGFVAHDRFIDGRTEISEIRIYQQRLGQPIDDDWGFRWRRGDMPHAASIDLIGVRPS
jgi:GDSL-like lipase/acylhydrolase family protein